MQSMTLADNLIRGIADGDRSAAIWRGRHDLSRGPLKLTTPGGDLSVQVEVSEVRHKPFIDVDDREARDSGEADREALWQVLSAHYTDMTHSDEVTIALIGQ